MGLRNFLRRLFNRNKIEINFIKPGENKLESYLNSLRTNTSDQDKSNIIENYDSNEIV